MRADAVGAQQPPPGLGDGGLVGRARGDVGGPGVGGEGPGGRQRAPVDLAVGGQRERVEADQRGRDHGRGQPVAQERAQAPRRPAVRCHDVARQAHGSVRGLGGGDGGPGNLGVGDERRLDLAGFDPHPVDLGLAVDAPAVLQRAVGTPAG